MKGLPRNRDELLDRWSVGERFEFYLFYGHKPPAAGVDASCLSQWFVSPFEIDGVEYPTAEHWMMAEKARLFGDDKMLAEILVSSGPREAKALGRKVKGFDFQVWGKHRYDIVKIGNLAKFGQDVDLLEFLLSTAQPQETLGYAKVAESETPYRIDDSAKQSSDVVREQLRLYRNDAEEDSQEDSASHRDGDRTPGTDTGTVILVEAAGRDCIWGIGLGKQNPKSLDPTQWRGQNLLGFALTEVREMLSTRQNQVIR